MTRGGFDASRFDTVLLDMDGTLLDLAFDNFFWRELVPRAMAESERMDVGEARQHLYDKYAAVEGTLAWYCLDHWTRELSLDIRALKSAASHRIRYLPGARTFLCEARVSCRRLLLVTNAHGDTLRIKSELTGLARYFDVCITSHEIGAAKEHPDFWAGLAEKESFDPERTLLVDDSHPVLDAASEFGLGGVLGITNPDSRLSSREPGRHDAVESVAQIVWSEAD